MLAMWDGIACMLHTSSHLHKLQPLQHAALLPVQVRYLQIPKRDKSYQPYRWVRYVTLSSSYVVRT